ncbi:MAG: hypothetical protein KHX91_08785 [Clostridium sp.]|nr:hypothetical protein [Clostridium sp.]
MTLPYDIGVYINNHTGEIFPTNNSVDSLWQKRNAYCSSKEK